MHSKSLFLLVFAIALPLGFFGCSDDETPTSPNPPADTNEVRRNNLQPDSSVGWLYYSFDLDSVINPSQAATDLWDIRLAYLRGGGATRAVTIHVNSGTVNSAGKSQGVTIDTTYDLLRTVPALSAFRNDDTTNTIVSKAVDGTGMFNYNPQARTIVPNPQKTLVVRTRSGRFAKVQVVSIYKDAPASPTMMSEIGHYTLRYVKNNGTSFR